jgi:hypothetical protein
MDNQTDRDLELLDQDLMAGVITAQEHERATREIFRDDADGRREREYSDDWEHRL